MLVTPLLSRIKSIRRSNVHSCIAVAWGKGSSASTSRFSSTHTSHSPVGHLILVRHGQSVWNVTDPDQGTTSRFTGWTNVDLSGRGLQQAEAAGRALKEYRDEEGGGLKIDSCFCSLLVRAERTLDIICSSLGLSTSPGNYNVPVTYSWRLNERHYGNLVGMSKIEAEVEFGVEQLGAWR